MLEINRKIIYTSVNEKDLVLHCHLLEHFVSIKPRIDIWAMKNMIDPVTAWTCYINMGVYRLVDWFRASYDGLIDLNRDIPPLDVLLVWHALLQDAVAWNDFVDESKLFFARWNPDELSKALGGNRQGLFEPSLGCMDRINRIYRAPDAGTLMNLSVDYVFSVSPNETTQEVFRLFSQKRLNHTLMTPRGQHHFSYDFHKAVQLQLDLAEQDVNFSWHRVYVTREENERVLKPAIQRYRRFMTLEKFRERIRYWRFEYPDHIRFTDFDIHLVWRTHKLLPQNYGRFCGGYFGGLVYRIPDPPDTHEISVSRLRSNDQIYEHLFGEEYALCLCWPCVKGRRDKPPGWRCFERFTRPAVKTQLTAEMDRRRAAAVIIPLGFAQKQCRKCGSHPRRHCRKKDMIEVPATKTLGRSVSNRVPTPGTSIASLCSPSQIGVAPVPFRGLGMSPYCSESLDQTRLQSPLPPPASATVTQEPTLRNRNIELRGNSRSHNSTPDLTVGSTRSGDSDVELAPSYYTLTKTLSMYQISANESQFTPRNDNWNVVATAGGPRDRPNASTSNGPEPGAWLAG
ncbi:chloroperoxidase [Fusarium beomiforme]|uniref:Chloroperoxidase n=1 Tax=Fusarium beomiforme TaxID=44412 RepID=A0A9P5AFE4_9HYPO|nr:chloroperoxidase [Fusarium beomiforme]